MDADARLEVIEEENALLRERIRQLEGLLGHHFIAPVEWRLTGSEMRVLGVLLARDMATKDAILAALYRDTHKDEAEPKIVDVFICKIRGKLRPFGIEIETLWGQGYRLSAEMKARIRADLPEQEEAA